MKTDLQKLRQFPTYSHYRPSGIEWLGDLPEHWEIKRLKHVVKCLDSKRIPLNSEQRGKMQGEYPYWGANGIVDYVNEWLFDEQLVLLGEDGAPFFEKYKDVAFFVSGKIWVNNHAHVLKAENAYPKFLTYQLNTVDYSSYIEGTTRDKLTQNDMNEIAFQAPPLSEQRAIANFLDREMGRIDGLIEKKEQLIELLKEKRQALISHAVTKGLNPNAPMKDSDIEWLDKIPVHWEIKKLKYLARSPLQYGANEAGGLNDPDNPRFIRITDIESNGQLRDDTFCSLPEDVAKPFLLELGDILFARSGATVGKSFMYRESWGRACFAGYLIRFRTHTEKIETEFINYFTQSWSYNSWKDSIFIQATIQNISAEKYGNFAIIVPPKEEQQLIVAFLDRESGRIDGLISKTRESIEKLREYRTALITAAVTGKIDVGKI